MENMEKKKENLIAINEWCKSIAQDEIIYVDNALFCNGRNYKLSISKNGIGVCADEKFGKFSHWFHCTESHDSLFDIKVGSELIYEWTNVKQKILDAVDKYKRRQYRMEHFIV